ncbi:MAG: DUF4197 domain-containing protein [Bacteroidales bacterium]|jgi:hypothetical protein|nr:DUF4197 domain-containing protein [Bacteroidales bacterium]
MKRFILQATALLLSAQLFFSCEEINNILPSDTQLSKDEIVNGLKSALIAGADSSTRVLSTADGYYNDLATRIDLPDEVQTILDNAQIIENLPGVSLIAPNLTNDLQAKVTDLVKSINSSAGEAAKEALPIFKNAITDLSITDGLSILQGKIVLKSGEFDSTAATQYLKSATFTGLTETYAPYMNEALGKPFAGNLSATEIWTSITGTYNTIVNNKIVQSAAQLAGHSFQAVDTDLGAFVTGKALDGLFLKVEEQERKIRKNPLQYASDIIQKVFGYVFK